MRSTRRVITSTWWITIQRARYRNSWTRPEPMIPGKPYELTVTLWPTSNVFKQGHRIRVDVSSSNFPRFRREPEHRRAGGQAHADGHGRQHRAHQHPPFRHVSSCRSFHGRGMARPRPTTRLAVLYARSGSNVLYRSFPSLKEENDASQKIVDIRADRPCGDRDGLWRRRGRPSGGSGRCRRCGAASTDGSG